MNRIRFSLTTIILIAVSLAGWSKVVEEVVIKVNDAIITRSEYESRLKSTMEGIKREYKGPDLQKKLKELPQNLLEQMEDELLLVEKAKTMYQINMIVDQQVKSFMKENNLKTKADLAKALKKEGLTLDDFNRQVTMIYIPQFMMSREIRSNITISTAEIEDYFKKHKSELETKPRVKLQEILLLKKQYTPEQAADLASRIMAEYKAGTDFGELAGRYSQAFSRTKKGEAGWFEKGDLNQVISQAVFALKKGDVTKLIKTGSGWYLFRVEDVRKAEMPTLEKARQKIVDALKQKKFKKAYDDYIKKIKTENYVWINPKYV